uniref:Uncharacterized protein n=1 Tax=Stomoxys calcitrans TaxID=35570 RepID=A0A1I8P221_STOCA
MSLIIENCIQWKNESHGKYTTPTMIWCEGFKRRKLVLSDLGEQRESLLRSTRRLEDADEDLSQSRRIVRKLQREFIYNKLILILIIFFEFAILIGLIVIKYIKL